MVVVPKELEAGGVHGAVHGGGCGLLERCTVRGLGEQDGEQWSVRTSATPHSLGGLGGGEP